MTGVAAAVSYLVLLVAGVRSGLGATRRDPGTPQRPGVATVVGLVVVAVPTLLQLAVAPGLLGHLQRDRAAVADGELWRLATSLVVQDGGVSGAAFILGSLAVVGAVAEQVWGSRRWVALALVAGVGAQDRWLRVAE